MGFPDFDFDQDQVDVMTMLGNFHGSHWEDPWLAEQFYLKGYNWTPEGDMEAGKTEMEAEIEEVIAYWNDILTIPGWKMDKNTK